MPEQSDTAGARRQEAEEDADERGFAWEHVDINTGASALRTSYEVADQRVVFEPADSPLPHGPYRALAATANHFARESHIDELAHAVGMDPLRFRLRNLDDERLIAVLESAADRAGWDEPSRDRLPGWGAGVACGTEKGGYVATCAHVRVEDGQVEVLRIVTAYECGAIINPDNVRRQIEGATVMGLGGALFEAVHFDDGRILNASLRSHRVPRFTDVPTIEVVLLDRPDLPPAGAGETPIVAVAPAVANAIFAATGIRLRSLPLLVDFRHVGASGGHFDSTLPGGLGWLSSAAIASGQAESPGYRVVRR